MRNYYRLVIGVLLMMGGCGFTKDYFSDDRKRQREEQMANMEMLIASGKESNAILDSVYKETTMKILGARVKLYETNYTFIVDGQTFTGVYKPQNPPNELFITIKYLPQDPSINNENPDSELQSLKSQSESTASLYIGLILLAIGAFTVFQNIQAIRNRKRQEELEEQRKLDEYNKSKGVEV